MMTAPRELDDTELQKLLVAALGALVSAAPDCELVIARESLHHKRICVEVLETGDVVFSIAPGTTQ
jgi:hypothetical protein